MTSAKNRAVMLLGESMPAAEALDNPASADYTYSKID
jgi:hypothetical protein